MPDASRSQLGATSRRRLTTDMVRGALLGVGVLAGLMVVLQVVNWLSASWLTQHLGIRPRTWDGLWGVLFAPVLHGSWTHLFSNLLLVVVLGFLVALDGARRFAAVTAVIWLVSGLGVWLTAPPHSVTIGASMLVFGWLTYLVVRGFMTRDVWQIVLGVVLIVTLGGMFWTGIAVAAFGSSAVSWQGHLFGAAGGVLAAVQVGRAGRGRTTA